VKVGIISGTCYPCNPNTYGSEIEACLLADELGKEHEVTLFAATKSIKGNYDLKLLPCVWGKLSYGIEKLVLQYDDILKDMDYVIDMSPLCMYTEHVYFWHRERLKKQVLVYVRNGTSLDNPRQPIPLHINGVVLSKSAKQAIINQGVPLNPDLLHVIPYGIQTEWYKPTKTTKDYVLYLGAPREEKGIFTILKLAKQLPEQKFVFAWHALSEEHKRIGAVWKRQASKLSNVKFREIPNLQAKLNAYQNAKCFVQLNNPNYIEAFGLCIAEALSCGTPVVLFNRPEHKELFGEVACFGRDLKDVAEIITSKGVFPSAKECRQFIVKNYSLDKFAKRYVELCERIRKRSAFR